MTEEYSQHQRNKYTILENARHYKTISLFDELPEGTISFWSIPELSLYYDSFQNISPTQITEINSVLKSKKNTHITEEQITPYGCFYLFNQCPGNFVEKAYFLVPDEKNFTSVLHTALNFERIDIRKQITPINYSINGIAQTYNIAQHYIWNIIKREFFATTNLDQIHKPDFDYMGYFSLRALYPELFRLVQDANNAQILQNTNFNIIMAATDAGLRARNNAINFGIEPRLDTKNHPIKELKKEIRELTSEFKKKFGQQYIR